MKQKTVIITGGAGFIGSHLCDEYIKRNYKVVCVDNFITGNKNNIKHLIDNPSFLLLKADVSFHKDFKKIKSIFKKKLLKADLILHFASPAGPNPNSPKSYLKYPIKTYLVNSFGTHYLLELAKKMGSEFVFASTSEVYGNPLEHPQKENYFGNVNPIGTRSCYDESKRFGEMATITFGKKFNLNSKIIRIFNTYGPRMTPDDGRVIPQFILQALNNKPITIYGSGKQTRSFCYIDDLVNGIQLIVDKATSFDVFNLGNDKEIKINTLAEKIKSLTKSSSKMIFKKLPKDDPEKRKPDLSKLRNLFKWQPEVNLNNGLIKTIDYFKKEGV
ncbi:SDR family NAD(P)-dependent oxidoreductase [Patescibacteria group bacterium]